MDTSFKVFFELTEFCFKAKKGNYTTVDKYGANYLTQYKESLSNCFFKLVMVLQLVIGITIGSYPALFFASLFLAYYKKNELKNFKKLILKGLDAFEIVLDSMMT